MRPPVYGDDRLFTNSTACASWLESSRRAFADSMPSECEQHGAPHISRSGRKNGQPVTAASASREFSRFDARADLFLADELIHECRQLAIEPLH